MAVSVLRGMAEQSTPLNVKSSPYQNTLLLSAFPHTQYLAFLEKRWGAGGRGKLLFTWDRSFPLPPDSISGTAAAGAAAGDEADFAAEVRTEFFADFGIDKFDAGLNDTQHAAVRDGQGEDTVFKTRGGKIFYQGFAAVFLPILSQLDVSGNIISADIFDNAVEGISERFCLNGMGSDLGSGVFFAVPVPQKAVADGAGLQISAFECVCHQKFVSTPIIFSGSRRVCTTSLQGAMQPLKV